MKNTKPNIKTVTDNILEHVFVETADQSRADKKEKKKRGGEKLYSLAPSSNIYLFIFLGDFFRGILIC